LSTGAINLGQRSREALGREALFIVGFAPHFGDVVAANRWGARRTVFTLPAARQDCWDDALHRAFGGRDGWLLLDASGRSDPLLVSQKPQRAVGVVYGPKQERINNDPQTRLADRFDALLFITRTHALEPLP
jgi:erythromycin esterase